MIIRFLLARSPNAWPDKWVPLQCYHVHALEFTVTAAATAHASTGCGRGLLAEPLVPLCGEVTQFRYICVLEAAKGTQNHLFMCN